MTLAPSRPRSRTHKAAALLMTLLAPVILYFVIRSAAAVISPGAAVTLPPADYAPVLRGISRILIDPRVPLRSEYVAIAERTAIASPLAFEPFLIFARQAADRRDWQRATRLAEEARRRRPNFMATRILLMDYYARSGRPAEAVAEMDYVLRYNEPARQAVFPELVKLLRLPEARRALAPVLARNPPWRGEFLISAESHGVDPAHAKDIYERVASAQPQQGAALERRLYLQSLVRTGQAPLARTIWLAALPADQRGHNAYVFDGSFTGARAPQPFMWVLHDNDVGRAEINADVRPSHLSTTYFGGRPALLAEQILALVPGTYALSFSAKSDSGVSSGELFWSLTCLSGTRELARIPIRTPSQTYRGYRAAVTVPAGCAGQRLQLRAEPGDIAAVVELQIADLKVTRP